MSTTHHSPRLIVETGAGHLFRVIQDATVQAWTCIRVRRAPHGFADAAKAKPVTIKKEGCKIVKVGA